MTEHILIKVVAFFVTIFYMGVHEWRYFNKHRKDYLVDDDIYAQTMASVTISLLFFCFVEWAIKYYFIK